MKLEKAHRIREEDNQVDCQNMADTGVERYGRIDVLQNNVVSPHNKACLRSGDSMAGPKPRWAGSVFQNQPLLATLNMVSC